MQVKYQTIVADPPWPYESSDGGMLRASTKHRPNSGGAKAKSVGIANGRYDAMSVENICNLWVPAAANAHLYLWTTNAFMVEAHEVARAWGFKPKTICTWVKTHHGDAERVSMKTGYYFRGATEHFLFCVRGSLPLNNHSLPTAYLWHRLPHSVKPDAFYDLVETASPGPYIELFSRRARFGWDVWGDESLATVDLVSAGSNPARCPVCEGLDQPGLLHNPLAPYCSESNQESQP